VAKSITIRNVSDETSAELASRAAANGQSLQEYLRAELDRLAERPDVPTWVRRVRTRVEKSGSTLSANDILRFRDEGHR
jgi:antitoxin FitA